MLKGPRKHFLEAAFVFIRRLRNRHAVQINPLFPIQRSAKKGHFGKRIGRRTRRNFQYIDIACGTVQTIEHRDNKTTDAIQPRGRDRNVVQFS